MLTYLEIENFKAWKQTSGIRLAPLTVFFGSNSSGKTSLLQLLLLLKQTAESPDRRRVLHLGDRQTPVDLGTFQDVIFGHDEEENLRFRLLWTLDEEWKFQDPKSKVRYACDALDIDVRLGKAEKNDGRLEVKDLTYGLRLKDKQVIEIWMRPLDSDSKYGLEAEGYTLVRNTGRKWPLPAPVKCYGFPDEAVAYFQNTGFLSFLNLELERLFSGLFYLGPLRGHPQRTYLWSGEKPEHVGWQGERTIEALLAARGRRISKGEKKRAKPFEEVIARWLEEMGLIESFRVRPIADGRKEYEVRVKTRRGSDDVNLTDVGFGVSQVLPVLVQCFYAPRGATLIMEQPEIHLHPRVQASLADLFIETIQAKEDGEPRRVQLLVESHSEHFLRRLQRRVAEQKLRPEDVAIYFCEPSRDGSKITKLNVDLFGNITNWPEDFFGDEIGDLAAMTEAAMERQIQVASS